MLKNLNPAFSSGAVPFGVIPKRSGNQRSKSILQALIGVAVIVLLFGSMISYLMSNAISKSQIRIANLQAEAGSSKQVTLRYASTVSNYNDTESQLSFLETSVSQKQYVPTLLQQLQTLAISTHLQVQSVKPGPLASLAVKPTPPPAASAPGSTSSAGPQLIAVKVTPPAYDTLPVTLQVNGTYREIMAFIYDLPKFPKILSLQSVSFHPGGGPSGALPLGTSPMLSATLSINAYLFDPTTPVTVAAAASAAPGGFTAVHSTEASVIDQASGAKTDDPGSPSAPPSFSPQPTSAAVPGSVK